MIVNKSNDKYYGLALNFAVIIILCLATFAVTFPGVASANTLEEASSETSLQMKPNISKKAALERLFTSSTIKPEWFAPSFRLQIPISQLQQIINNIKIQLGTYQGLKKDGDDYLVLLKNGSVPTKIVLNSKGEIIGLLFQASKVSNLEQAINDFKSLPGKVSLIVQGEGSEKNSNLAALNTSKPLAVASAFKLAVLKTLKSEIAAKKLAWNQVVTLKEEWKSLPSGILQDWEDDSPVTIQTLATLMISLSDNTATDTLINVLGRESVEKNLPPENLSQNLPLLTTRELFVLKGSENRNLLQKYRRGNENQRRGILSNLVKLTLPDVKEFINTKPNALDVEWFFTTEELCSLINDVADLPLMSVNPGIIDAKKWEKVAYKGGSEPGVINMTTWLEAKNGKRYCVSGTWNNPQIPVDESRFSLLYGGVISFLEDQK